MDNIKSLQYSFEFSQNTGMNRAKGWRDNSEHNRAKSSKRNTEWRDRLEEESNHSSASSGGKSPIKVLRTRRSLAPVNYRVDSDSEKELKQSSSNAIDSRNTKRQKRYEERKSESSPHQDFHFDAEMQDQDANYDQHRPDYSESLSASEKRKQREGSQSRKSEDRNPVGSQKKTKGKSPIKKRIKKVRTKKHAADNDEEYKIEQVKVSKLPKGEKGAIKKAIKTLRSSYQESWSKCSTIVLKLEHQSTTDQSKKGKSKTVKEYIIRVDNLKGIMPKTKQLSKKTLKLIYEDLKKLNIGKPEPNMEHHDKKLLSYKYDGKASLIRCMVEGCESEELFDPHMNTESRIAKFNQKFISQLEMDEKEEIEDEEDEEDERLDIEGTEEYKNREIRKAEKEKRAAARKTKQIQKLQKIEEGRVHRI